MSRRDFIEALGRAEVPACQVTSEELTEEVEPCLPSIVNASPILTKIGRIELLNAEDVDVVVPLPVLQEVCPDLANPADPVVQAIAAPAGGRAPVASPNP